MHNQTQRTEVRLGQALEFAVRRVCSKRATCAVSQVIGPRPLASILSIFPPLFFLPLASIAPLSHRFIKPWNCEWPLPLPLVTGWELLLDSVHLYTHKDNSWELPPLEMEG